LDDAMGKIFEQICRDAFRRHHRHWGFVGADQWARWKGQDRNRRSIEIDLVARLDDGHVLTGEVKWASRPLGPDIHWHLLRNLEDLARSGQGWAKDALNPARTAGHLYVGASGFDDDFLRLSEDDKRIHLLTLNDLYGGTSSA
jgi:hypothetical protein